MDHPTPNQAPIPGDQSPGRHGETAPNPTANRDENTLLLINFLRRNLQSFIRLNIVQSERLVDLKRRLQESESLSDDTYLGLLRVAAEIFHYQQEFENQRRIADDALADFENMVELKEDMEYQRDAWMGRCEQFEDRAGELGNQVKELDEDVEKQKNIANNAMREAEIASKERDVFKEKYKELEEELERTKLEMGRENRALKRKVEGRES